jgi:acetyltransferase-like isoleucine patch superfamily enzyme
VQGVFLTAAFPIALLCGFGRWTVLWSLLGQAAAMAPGFLGTFWRAAFYRLTLDDSSVDVVIAFGTFFSRQQVTLEQNVSIGSYCVIGRAKIGARTQISSHVEIPGGRLQHVRDAQGRLSESVDLATDQVIIGRDCWIGAAAVVLANVGDQSTIGAGSVVTKDIPAGMVAVGVPARPIKSSLQTADAEGEGYRRGE